MTYFCRLCDMAISASGLLDHLRDRHPSIAVALDSDPNVLFTRKAPETSATPTPIPLILHCPGMNPDRTVCGARHVDTGLWATKPHHTHSCQVCGFTWRPGVIHTVGVQFLPGFKNENYEWERLCKSCAANLHDAEFHEAKERGCEVCGFMGGTVMNDYLMVRAPGAETVRKGRIERGHLVLVAGAFRSGSFDTATSDEPLVTPGPFTAYRRPL